MLLHVISHTKFVYFWVWLEYNRAIGHTESNLTSAGVWLNPVLFLTSPGCISLLELLSSHTVPPFPFAVRLVPKLYDKQSAFMKHLSSQSSFVIISWLLSMTRPSRICPSSEGLNLNVRQPSFLWDQKYEKIAREVNYNMPFSKLPKRKERNREKARKKQRKKKKEKRKKQEKRSKSRLARNIWATQRLISTCLSTPSEVVWDIFVYVESGLLGFGIRNAAAQGTQNPATKWNPESKFH